MFYYTDLDSIQTKLNWLNKEALKHVSGAELTSLSSCCMFPHHFHQAQVSQACWTLQNEGLALVSAHWAEA